MPLVELDRKLIQRCLDRDAEAWYEFVDRFSGVIYHVIHHSTHLRSIPLSPDEVDDLAADVMTRIVENDFKILRSFRGRSSLATYLAVIARRIVVNALARKAAVKRHRAAVAAEKAVERAHQEPADEHIATQDEVKQLLEDLEDEEAELVRSFYLDHLSYRDISQNMGIPENTIGPMLSRIRARYRKANAGD